LGSVGAQGRCEAGYAGAEGLQWDYFTGHGRRLPRAAGKPPWGWGGAEVSAAALLGLAGRAEVAAAAAVVVDDVDALVAAAFDVAHFRLSVVLLGADGGAGGGAHAGADDGAFAAAQFCP